MYTLKLNKGKHEIRLGPKVDGEYPVLSSTLETEGKALVIDPDSCKEDVINCDESSDWAQCFGLSSCVEVDGCVIGTLGMQARNIDLLQYALNKVKFLAVDSDEI